MSMHVLLDELGDVGFDALSYSLINPYVLNTHVQTYRPPDSISKVVIPLLKHEFSGQLT